ncbi:metal-dependent transcriptional regulator [Candidatus Micrarchaeota archaeon]|nr:metal-dependent transcriptional regulator [Candidatus Micrarchaeota archaeon]
MQEKTIEEYCRLIDKLDVSGDGIRSIEISKKLDLSKNTVAITLHKLVENKFVEMERYGKVKLTKKGAEIAKKMNFKHRVIETFLFSKLHIAKTKIHEEACVIEHSMSDDVAEKLYEFIGKPKTDPHGSSIA